MTVFFGGAPPDPHRPSWEIDEGTLSPVTCMLAYMMKVWAVDNPLPTELPELAGFTFSFVIQSYKAWAAINSVQPLLREGVTVTQAWTMRQLATREEWTCLVHPDVPDLTELGGISRLVVTEPERILRLAAQATALAPSLCEAYVLFPEGYGHVITLESYDNDRFHYWDPWPGRTLLAGYVADGAIQPYAGPKRYWTIAPSTLEPLLYGVSVPTACWDELHGRPSTRPARREPNRVPIEALTRSQKNEILAFVVGCTRAGLLSDKGLVGVYLILEQGIMFDGSRHGETLIGSLRSLAERLASQPWDPEPTLTRTLLAVGEPSLVHQHVEQRSEPIRKSDSFGHVLRLFGNWLVECDDRAEARRWLTRAVEVSDGGSGALAMCDLGLLELTGGNVAEALVWLRRAADSGDPAASGAARLVLADLAAAVHESREADRRRAADADESRERDRRVAAFLAARKVERGG